MPAPISQHPAFWYVGAKVQAAVGTPVAPTKFGASDSFTSKMNMDSLIVNDATQRDKSLSFKFDQYYDWTWGTYLTPDNATYMIGLALSGVDTISGGADPYLHTIATAPTNLYPFTLEHSVGQVAPGTQFDVIRITDCYVKSAKISTKGGSVPLLTIQGTGLGPIPQGSATSPTFETDRQLVQADAAFTFSGLTMNGAITNLDIEVMNALTIVKRADSNAVLIIPGERTITVGFDAAVTDNALLRDIWYGSDAGTTMGHFLTSMTSLTAKWDLGGTPDHYLQLLLSTVKMTAADATFDKKGTTFEVKGVKGTAVLSGGTQPLVLTAQNAVSTAYYS